MEKMDMRTPDFVDGNIAKVAELFPNCVTESGEGEKAIDFDLLRQELSAQLVEGPQERYRLDWPGKREALVTANTPITKTLRPCREESVDFDTTENLFIEGDNLDALKLLQETYLGKIKMIYIDPPYNTGKDFIYKDNFTADKDEYLEESGQKDSEGGRLVANPESKGRYHSDWLSMMYPRLKLARNLLKDDGVIFISIDDNELHNAIKLGNEIFGEENFVALISVENNPKGRKNSRFISTSNDYCLIYSKEKDSSYFTENVPKNINDMTLDENGNYIHNSGKRVLVGENSFNKKVTDANSEKHYSVYYNNGDKDLIIRKEGSTEEIDTSLVDSGYKRYISHRDGAFIENTYTKTKLSELFGQGALDFKEDKIFEKNFSGLIRLKSMLTNREYDALVNNEKRRFKIDVKTTSAGTCLKELFETNESIFTAPKNIGLIKVLATLFEEKDFMILDFFAGSGTTAHALTELNFEDGGNRKYIMVQLHEVCDEKSVAYKAGFKTIAEIGKERIRRVGKRIKTENALTASGLDIGFRVLKIDESNMQDIYYRPDEIDQSQMKMFTDNIKADRTAEDLLFQVLLDWGVDLTLPVTQETISGQEVFFVDENALAACFADDGEITEDFCKALAQKEPLRVVFRDSGFKDDSVRINVEQIFKLMSPHTEVKSL